MTAEFSIQNARAGQTYRVVGANAQPPTLRVGDLIRLEEDDKGRLIRHNLTRDDAVPYYNTDPGVWVTPVD